MTDHDKQAGPFKVGGELLPYHPQASHVSPDYRDGWNHCFAAMSARIAELEAELSRLREPLSDEQLNDLIPSPYVGDEYLGYSRSDICRIARAIERAHGIQGKEG